MDGSLMMQSQAFQLPEQQFHQAISWMFTRAFLRGRLNQGIGRFFHRERRLIDLQAALKNGDIRNSLRRRHPDCANRQDTRQPRAGWKISTPACGRLRSIPARVG